MQEKKESATGSSFTMYNLKSPAPLNLGKQVLHFALHPSEDLLVSGLITGKIDWYVHVKK